MLEYIIEVIIWTVILFGVFEIIRTKIESFFVDINNIYCKTKSGIRKT